MNLRNLARGQQCRIRIPGICTHNPAQTVLAHYRIGGLCGTGMKPHDLIGADACAACHDAVDGRRATQFSRDELRLMHAEGVMRTISARMESLKVVKA